MNIKVGCIMTNEDILKTLYAGYYSLYLVDGKTGKYTVLHTTGLYEQYNQEVNDFEGAIYDYACNYVHEKDKNRVISNSKLSLVKETLKTERDVVITYQMKNSEEWRSLNFIRTTDYENSEKFLMGITIHNKVQQQDFNANMLKDVLSLISEDFQAIYRINLKTDKLETLYYKINSDYYVNQDIPYSYIETEYRNHYVDKSFLQEMNAKMSRNVITEHFSVSDEPRTYYYKENNGNWYKMIMYKDNTYSDDHPYIILAVKESANDITLERNRIIGNLLMSKMFSLTALIDIRNNTYEIFHSENDFYKKETSGRFDKLMESSKEYIYEEDYDQYYSIFYDESLKPNTFKERIFRAEDITGMMHFYNAIVAKLIVPDGEKLLLIITNEDEREINRTRYERLEKQHNITQNTLYALGDMYYAMYYYDSDNGRIELIKIPKDLKSMAYESNTYETFFKKYANIKVHPDYRERFLKCTSLEYINGEIRKGRTNINYEFMQKFNDEYRWVSLDIQIMTSKNGQVKEMVFAEKDIHEERNAELQHNNELKTALTEAKIANAAKSEFLSNMSHDMRTPMNAILGMTDIALMHMDDEERVLNSLNKIKMSGKHLLELINEVLDMSHIESGKLIFKKDVVCLPELFHEIVCMFQDRIKNKHLYFKAEAIGVTNETVITDVVRIRQILTNVLINAIKYTTEYGRINLTLEQLPGITEGVAEYRIMISDTGIGMSQDFLQKLYEPFERAIDTTNSGIEGIGLGMSITMKLVQALGGNIEVKSDIGKGTTFEITIPFEHSTEYVESKTKTDLSDYQIIYYENEDADLINRIRESCKTGKTAIIHSYDISEYVKDINELGITKIYLEPVFNSDLNETDNEQQEDYENTGAPLIHKKVLVTDDNDINLCIVCDYLEDMGITVETATNGKEAYEKIISDNSFDLVLMDVRMPVMDGYEATRKIRTYGQTYTNNIPIIAMTANAFEEDIAMSKQVGMNEHISKPIEFDKFTATILKFLDI